MPDGRRPGTKLSAVLFFTRGMSLREWDKLGILDREVALYLKLKEEVDISFVTYGDGGELAYATRLPGITICCNRWGLPMNWYEKLIPWLHMQTIRQCALIKTNQMDGAEVAMVTARVWKKPLLARCGYMYSKNEALEHGVGSIAAQKARTLEEEVFHEARRIQVTAVEMVDDIALRFPELEGRVSLVPNHVDTDLFSPGPSIDSDRIKFCYVGRLSPEKNLDSLVEAVRELDLELTIIGQGALRERLNEQIAGNDRIRVAGPIPNSQLPFLLRQCDAFILPSLYEGHPKSLVEAMACGLPVIGANVSGIRDVIRHGETGLLCGTDPVSIRSAVTTILSDPPLRRRLGQHARMYVEENLSLDKVAQLELAVYAKVADTRAPAC